MDGCLSVNRVCVRKGIRSQWWVGPVPSCFTRPFRGLSRGHALELCASQQATRLHTKEEGQHCRAGGYNSLTYYRTLMNGVSPISGVPGVSETDSSGMTAEGYIYIYI